MIRWCCGLAEGQVNVGKHFLFESARGSGAWKLPEVQRLGNKHFVIDVPACAVGLRDKDSGKPFGKSWRFITLSESIALQLGKLVCSGDHEHQLVEGSSGGVARSIQSQVYPPTLVRRIQAGAVAQDHWSDTCSNVLTTEELKGEGRRKVENALKKMHVNLGHASIPDMIRILQHRGASEGLLDMVRAFDCPTCAARKEPKIVRASAVPKDVAPLRYVGLDVKHLPSWRKGEKIKALNVVCRTSGLQQMTPFRETESSDLIRRLYRQSWTRPYGRPRWVKFDASRCNLGQHFIDALERDGTTPLDIPGEAHEQIGDVEVQGKHFEDMLIKVLDQANPSNYDEWVECVDCTVEAKNMLLRKAGHSPYQMVLGRDPEIPGDDILTPDPNPIANGAILEDAQAGRAHLVRQFARKAVLEAADCKAGRVALNSRPRPQREFRHGDQVAVWRRGRGIPGKRGYARWRGPGIIAGEAGGNFWVAMPGSFIKCSPEQLRLRTLEEREADRFLVRDLRLAAANLYPEVGGTNPHQKNFLDITGADYFPGSAPPVIEVTARQRRQASSLRFRKVGILRFPEPKFRQTTRR